MEVLVFKIAFRGCGSDDLHACFVELMAARKAHDSADAVDIIFQTDYALSLLASHQRLADRPLESSSSGTVLIAILGIGERVG